MRWHSEEWDRGQKKSGSRNKKSGSKKKRDKKKIGLDSNEKKERKEGKEGKEGKTKGTNVARKDAKDNGQK